MLITLNFSLSLYWRGGGDLTSSRVEEKLLIISFIARLKQNACYFFTFYFTIQSRKQLKRIDELSNFFIYIYTGYNL